MQSATKNARACGLHTIGIALLLTANGCGHEQPHYSFELPDGYIGWIQVIFSSPNAPAPPFTGNKLHLQIDESGIFKTSMTSTVFSGSHDEFFYRRRLDASGKESLVPVPANYVCAEDSGIDSCLGSEGTVTDEFTVGRANLGHSNDGTPGLSWFLFVGPPELRQKYAKRIHRAAGARYQIDAPEDDPKPGRIRQ
jgi:uncharacterized protein DUF6843